MQTDSLITLVGRRVVKWQFEKMFKYELKAKRFAARLFIENKGVRVTPVKSNWFVYSWRGATHSVKDTGGHIQ